MGLPHVDEHGQRWYARTRNNPQGIAEDTTRCIEEIWERGGGSKSRQCGHRRVCGPEGLFCRQHGKQHVAEVTESVADAPTREDEMKRRMEQIDAAALAAQCALAPLGSSGVLRAQKQLWTIRRLATNTDSPHKEESKHELSHEIPGSAEVQEGTDDAGTVDAPADAGR